MAGFEEWQLRLDSPAWAWIKLTAEDERIDTEIGAYMGVLQNAPTDQEGWVEASAEDVAKLDYDLAVKAQFLGFLAELAEMPDLGVNGFLMDLEEYAQDHCNDSAEDMRMHALLGLLDIAAAAVKNPEIRKLLEFSGFGE